MGDMLGLWPGPREEMMVAGPRQITVEVVRRVKFSLYLDDFMHVRGGAARDEVMC